MRALRGDLSEYYPIVFHSIVFSFRLAMKMHRLRLDQIKFAMNKLCHCLFPRRKYNETCKTKLFHLNVENLCGLLD